MQDEAEDEESQSNHEKDMGPLLLKSSKSKKFIIMIIILRCYQKIKD